MVFLSVVSEPPRQTGSGANPPPVVSEQPRRRAERNPLGYIWIYSGRRRPFARSCRHYFRIASLPDLRSAVVVVLEWSFGCQRELKDGAVRRVRRRPEMPAMRLDDR